MDWTVAQLALGLTWADFDLLSVHRFGLQPVTFKFLGEAVLPGCFTPNGRRFDSQEKRLYLFPFETHY